MVETRLFSKKTSFNCNSGADYISRQKGVIDWRNTHSSATGSSEGVSGGSLAASTSGVGSDGGSPSAGASTVKDCRVSVHSVSLNNLLSLLNDGSRVGLDSELQNLSQ